VIRLVEDWRDLPPDARGASVALGNFDGVHLGHRAVVAAAVHEARRRGVSAGVISFEPHPRKWFQPDAEPFRVMSRGQQARALEDLGVDILYALPFDAEMAAMTDEAFAERVLAKGLGVRHVATGFDVTFGKDRTGDGESLTRYGERLGFAVTTVDRVADLEGEKYSSSAARAALKQGRPEAVAHILGRPFSIEGVVSPGDQRGRLLGFPTANVPLGDYVRPAFGVYATRSRLPDGRVIPGVANLGLRPTVAGVDERLEVHLFDFNEDIYGQVIETELVAFLRPEQKFAGLDALKDQIARDVEAAKRALDL
jgi:riboflavin kinase/FMN adenylyltransferase